MSKRPNGNHDPPSKRRRIDNRAINNGHKGEQKQQAPWIDKIQQIHSERELIRFHSFLGLQNRDDITKYIIKFLENAFTNDHVETEFKLGKYLNKNARKEESKVNNNNDNNFEERICDTYGVETIGIMNNKHDNFKFDSSLTHNAFVRLNNLLNNWVNNSNKHHRNCTTGKDINFNKIKKEEEQQRHNYYHTYPNITYSRTKVIDKLYKNEGRKKSNIRVTLDINKPNTIKECIEKSRLGDKAIIYPKEFKYDIRLSNSIENIAPKPIGRIPEYVRCKDRISYKFDIFSIDLTVVSSYSQNVDHNFVELLRQNFIAKKSNLPRDHGYNKTYEFEVEIDKPKWFLKQRNKYRSKQPNQFVEACSFLVQLMHKLISVLSNDYQPQQCRKQ